MQHHVAISKHTKLGCPAIPYVFERKGDAVFFSPETLVGVRVNQSGKLALEAITENDTPQSLADKLAKTISMQADGILGSLLPFLQKMIEDRYLWRAESPPDIENQIAAADFKPFQLYLHITHSCNQSCVYCYNADYRNSVLKPELTLSEWKRLLLQAHEAGVREIIFTGGEPLLRPDVFDLASFGRDLDMRLCLLTNGTLILKRGADKVIKLFDSIFVSIDSRRGNEHDLLRGKGSHAKAAAGVRELCAGDHEKICLRPVITRHTVDSLPEYPAWAVSELGCRTILPTMYQPSSLKEHHGLKLMPDIAKFTKILHEFREASDKAGVSYMLDNAAFRSRGACGAGSQIISIDASGYVFPCQSLHYPEMSGGNIKEQSLRETGRAFPMRRLAEATVYLIPKCRDCSLKLICGGGCRALAYSLYRDIYAYNELFCPIFRGDAEDRLWNESERNRNKRSAEVDVC